MNKDFVKDSPPITVYDALCRVCNRVKPVCTMYVCPYDINKDVVMCDECMQDVLKLWRENYGANY